MTVIFNKPEIVGPWVCDRTEGQWTGHGETIGLENRSGKMIAGVLFEQYNGRSMLIHVAGEGSRWLTRGFLRIVFTYAFVQCKLRKLIGMVDSTNAKAIRFDEHLGFQLEARLRDAGKFGDLLLYTMAPEQCRYLSDRRETGQGVSNGR